MTGSGCVSWICVRDVIPGGVLNEVMINSKIIKDMYLKCLLYLGMNSFVFYSVSLVSFL